MNINIWFEYKSLRNNWPGLTLDQQSCKGDLTKWFRDPSREREAVGGDIKH